MVLTTPECVCMSRILQSDRDGKVLFTKSFRNSANIGRARREVNPIDLQKICWSWQIYTMKDIWQFDVSWSCTNKLFEVYREIKMNSARFHERSTQTKFEDTQNSNLSLPIKREYELRGICSESTPCCKFIPRNVFVFVYYHSGPSKTHSVSEA